MPTKAIAKCDSPKKEKRSIKRTRRRNIVLKSASWYSDAVRSIGISNFQRDERLRG
jgi:hypothetical protein